MPAGAPAYHTLQSLPRRPRWGAASHPGDSLRLRLRSTNYWSATVQLQRHVQVRHLYLSAGYFWPLLRMQLRPHYGRGRRHRLPTVCLIQFKKLLTTKASKFLFSLWIIYWLINSLIGDDELFKFTMENKRNDSLGRAVQPRQIIRPRLSQKSLFWVIIIRRNEIIRVCLFFFRGNSTLVCSGRGRCVCGECQCFPRPVSKNTHCEFYCSHCCTNFFFCLR